MLFWPTDPSDLSCVDEHTVAEDKPISEASLSIQVSSPLLEATTAHCDPAVEKHIDSPDVIGDLDDNRHPGEFGMQVLICLSDRNV